MTSNVYWSFQYYYHINKTKNDNNNKVAPYGTDGRLLLTANFKVTRHKNWDKNKKIRPRQALDIVP